MSASTLFYSTVMVTGANSFYSAAIMDRLVQINPKIKIHAVVRRESSRLPLIRPSMGC